jgi:diaminopimelate decarboxylase
MKFLNKEQVEQIADSFETPLYVYSEEKLIEAANNFLAFPNAF